MMRSSVMRSAMRLTRPVVVAKRAYSTPASHPAAPKATDLPWIIVSALVFIPTIFYMTAPPNEGAHDHHDAHAEAHHEEPEAVEQSEEEAPAAVTEPEAEPVVEEAPAVAQVEVATEAPLIAETTEDAIVAEAEAAASE